MSDTKTNDVTAEIVRHLSAAAAAIRAALDLEDFNNLEQVAAGVGLAWFGQEHHLDQSVLSDIMIQIAPPNTDDMIAALVDREDLGELDLGSCSRVDLCVVCTACNDELRNRADEEEEEEGADR